MFDLASGSISSTDDDRGIQMSLISFEMAVEYYTLMKKPFRIHTSTDSPGGSTGYLLIDGITTEGALAVDAKGNRRKIDREFILKHWGGQVTWVYPYGDNGFFLRQGMRSPAVSTLQQILRNLGYLVPRNGVFDQQTLEEVKRFQDEFGLEADGVVGFRTLTLLYQMADKTHELHP